MTDKNASSQDSLKSSQKVTMLIEHLGVSEQKAKKLASGFETASQLTDLLALTTEELEKGIADRFQEVEKVTSEMEANETYSEASETVKEFKASLGEVTKPLKKKANLMLAVRDFKAK